MLVDENNEAQTLAVDQELIFDVTTEEFEQKVMIASQKTPILVDFWAPWCGPCKQLMPLLEEEIKSLGGQVLLAKVNIDENQELAQALRVQSVPMVFAFFNGQPVNAFLGIKSPTDIKKFISELIQLARQSQPDAVNIDEVLSLGNEAFANGELNIAQSHYVQVLTEDENNQILLIGKPYFINYI